MEQKKTKTLLIRMSPELHKKMKLISVKNECSLNEYVIKAFEKIVAENEEVKKNEELY